MGTVEAAQATQLANIEKRTGKSLAELSDIVAASGLAKHGEIVAMLKRDLGMGHGDANALAHYAKKSAGPARVEAMAAASGGGDPADELYVGAKAGLRPIHDRLMAEIRAFGEFEVAPKKTYLSLRRKKQFAMIGPATNTKVEVGLNMKDVPATDRLVEMPPKGMCDYRIRLEDAAEVDAELVAWIRRAYESAG